MARSSLATPDLCMFSTRVTHPSSQVTLKYFSFSCEMWPTYSVSIAFLCELSHSLPCRTQIGHPYTEIKTLIHTYL